MEEVINALKQFLGEYIVAAAILVVAFAWFIWWLSSRYHSLMSKVEEINGLPCKAHDESLSKLSALLHKMEGQLEILVRNAVLKGNGMIISATGDAFSDKHSPRVLNQNGISLLNDCGGNEFLSRHMDYFIGKLERLHPKTALDVEELSIAVVQAATVEDMFIPLKNWVYEAPRRTIRNSDGSTREWDVTINDVIFVLALPVRDRYLETHKL